MALPVVTFTDPELSRPIPEPAFATGMQRGMNLAQQLQQMQQRATLMPEQIKQMQAEEMLRRAQAAKAIQPAPFDYKNPVKLWDLASTIYKRNPNDPHLPLLRDLINKARSSGRGISFTQTPGGGTSLQVGGMGTPGGAVVGGAQQVIPSTMAGRGAKGATFVDAATGKLTSSPTLRETTQLQNRIVGEHMLSNAADSLMGALDKMKSQGNSYFDAFTHYKGSVPLGLGKYIGPDYPEAASGLAGIKGILTTATERIGNMSAAPKVRDAWLAQLAQLKPLLNETRATYNSRVNGLRKLWAKNRGVATSALGKNIPVGQAAPQAPTRKSRTFGEYMTYGDRVPMAPAKTAPKATPTLRSAMQQPKKAASNDPLGIR